MGQIENGRWQWEPREFVGRLDLEPHSPAWNAPLMVEPGTAVWLRSGGEVWEELAPGTYMTQALMERSGRGPTAGLSLLFGRQQDLYLQLECDNFLTGDDLPAAVRCELNVVVKDARAVERRLMGPHPTATLGVLEQALLPLARQILWETMISCPLAEWQKPTARERVEALLLPQLNTYVLPYGIAVTAIRSWWVGQFDLDRQRRGTAQGQARARASLAKQAVDNDLAYEHGRLELQRREQVDELTGLAQQLATDRLEGQVAVKIRRLQLREELRAALVDARLAAGTVTDKLAEFRRSRDRNNVLGEHEYRTYAAELEHRHREQASRQTSLLKQLELQQEADLAALRLELDYRQQRQAHWAELELNRVVQQTADVEWHTQHQREMKRAERLHQQGLQAIELHRQQASAQALANHQVDTQALHQQTELERLRGELRFVQQQMASRVRLAETETAQAIQALESSAKFRERRTAHEHQKEVLQLQLATLAELNQLNQWNQRIASKGNGPESGEAEPCSGVGATSEAERAPASFMTRLAELKRIVEDLAGEQPKVEGARAPGRSAGGHAADVKVENPSMR